MKFRWFAVVWAVIASVPVARAAGPDRLRLLTVTVDGVDRTALVYAPATAATRPAMRPTPAPLVFVFHGHGGTSRAAERAFATDRLWPEAISVYPQGVDTPGPVTDPAGLRPGWQHAIGGQGDRDLHLFDALLARVRHDYAVDDARVYCTGHSNGGGFTYLLWQARPAVFAAVAACSAGGLNVARLTPKPAMICGGTADPTVPFAHQRRAMDAVRTLNRCDPTGSPWEAVATRYGSDAGPPLVTYVYPGGHAMDAAEPRLIVDFFRHGGGPATRPTTQPTTRPTTRPATAR